MPEDSSWNTAMVFPDERNLKTFSSSSGILSRLSFSVSGFLFIDLTALSIWKTKKLKSKGMEMALLIHL